jgi:hypothetical protein
MKRLLLLTGLLMFGCGGGGTSNTTSSTAGSPTDNNPPSSSATTVQGQWTFTGTSSSQGYQVAVFANLAQSDSTTFFASPSSVAVCVTPSAEPPLQAVSSPGSTCSMNTVPLDGTLAANSVTIGLMNVTSYNGGSESISATGSYSTQSSAVSAMQGSWTASGGDLPDGGNWTAQPNTPFTGTYNGTVNYNGSMPINATVTVTQDSNFGITGSISLNDPCYLGWNFSGNVVGGGFGAFNAAKTIISGAIQTSPGEITFGYKSVGGCVTAGVGVLTTSSAQDKVTQVSEAQRALLFSALDALEAKTKIAEKQRQALRQRFGPRT